MGSFRPSNSPVGTMVAVYRIIGARVFPAFQFPSWYNQRVVVDREVRVFPAFQFPSWYNPRGRDRRDGAVFPAFQFPSWYNPTRW